MDIKRTASAQRLLRFTPDENVELGAFLSASGQGFQAWAHDSLMALARSGSEVGSEPEPEPRPQTAIRDRQAAVVKAKRSDLAAGVAPRRTAPIPPPPPPQGKPVREPSTGWTPPPGGWSR